MHSAITGLGYAVPAQVLTNTELEKMVDTNAEWIVQRTGIKERRIADSNTATSDLAIEAARKAMADAGVSAKELDLIIVATVTPDYLFPSTACIVQREIGAIRAAAFDLGAACTGFLYGLTVANQFIGSGKYRHVLVVGADTLSKITDYTDRNTCILFGDGAGAAVVSASSGQGILSVNIGADGQGADLLMQPAGGSRQPATMETVNARGHYIKMAGQEVFKFAVNKINLAATQALNQAGINARDLRLLILHQANLRIIESAAKKLGIDRDRVYVNLDRYGNMSAASVPVAFAETREQGMLNIDDYILLVGFGGGLTWGAALIKWLQ
ncbi:MAG TPA: beta-ketoacyl-ACP synthase III [Candidatus Limnocylindrales bacterium]|nr:beta-ketoacyl-ACP synthase III [Candidatus Limnocylindrales bacterium]